MPQSRRVLDESDKTRPYTFSCFGAGALRLALLVILGLLSVFGIFEHFGAGALRLGYLAILGLLSVLVFSSKSETFSCFGAGALRLALLVILGLLAFLGLRKGLGVTPDPKIIKTRVRTYKSFSINMVYKKVNTS